MLIRRGSRCFIYGYCYPVFRESFTWISGALYSGNIHNVPVLMKKSKMNKFYGTISMIVAVRCFQEAGIGKQLAGSFG
ncbi:hypothetical protein OIU84_013667 [Salix udensis]|uniref:Uncharacterized protein n=1 Tax=Salix udensis TaxID=889485 RepID=A0AAD6JKL0_9ROSI|nr:hypothetical protein OIU84_013667 [Salix udensis]